MPVTCLVVDDHEAIRVGVTRHLTDSAGFEVAGLAATPGEALSLTLDVAPDVVVLDLVYDVSDAEHELHGADAVRAVLERWPQTAVLTYTTFDCPRCMVAVFAAGARDYLLKSESLDRLAAVIRAVHSGAPPSASLAGMVVAAVDGYRLSPRETQVLEQLSEGLTNRQIARRLGISDKTVASHLDAIRRTMRVGTRTQILAHAIRAGLTGFPNRSCACGAPAAHSPIPQRIGGRRA